MTFSSFLTEEDCQLVLDSSVVINVLATGYAPAILKALAVPVVVTDYVVGEIEKGTASGGAESGLLNELIADNVVRMAQIEATALQTFYGLVSGTVSVSLGDGEAATLAFAHGSNSSAIIDERKATRIAGERFGTLRLATTIDLLAHPNVCSALGPGVLGDATLRALQFARMQVREHQFEWVVALIGDENVDSCASLRRLARQHRGRSQKEFAR
jgi:predicted nucleic acid-binding protein